MLNKGIRSYLAADVPIFVFKDDATKQKVQRHLHDINDIITEKDIKNAKVPGTGDNSFELIKSGHKISSAKNFVEDTPSNH